MFRVTPLRPDEAPAFEAQTFPGYRALLRSGDGVAFGLWRDGVPVGLALGSCDGDAAEVLSLYVVPEARAQGGARHLLTALVSAFEQAGARHVSAVYTAGKPTTPALEALFTRAGWNGPEPRMLRVTARHSVMWGAPWIGRGTLGPEDRIVSWAEVTEADRRALEESQAASGWIPQDLLPWNNEEGHHPACSVALRHRGEIAGWVLTHALDDTTLRYTCSYMHPSLQRRARILPLYEEVMHRAEAHGLSRLIWTVPLVHAGMADFAKRWMAACADNVSETRGVWIDLGT